MTCPYAARFRKLVNMSPTQIRAWAKDPRSRCYSEAATRARLPALAKLKAKPPAQWTAKDCAFASRVVSFNARMIGAKKRDGCRDGYTISLRNWGHAPKCKLPTTCKARSPKGLRGTPPESLTERDARLWRERFAQASERASVDTRARQARADLAQALARATTPAARGAAFDAAIEAGVNAGEAMRLVKEHGGFKGSRGLGAIRKR